MACFSSELILGAARGKQNGGNSKKIGKRASLSTAVRDGYLSTVFNPLSETGVARRRGGGRTGVAGARWRLPRYRGPSFHS
jgi:hypothetical protein